MFYTVHGEHVGGRWREKSWRTSVMFVHRARRNMVQRAALRGDKVVPGGVQVAHDPALERRHICSVTMLAQAPIFQAAALVSFRWSARVLVMAF